MKYTVNNYGINKMESALKYARKFILCVLYLIIPFFIYISLYNQQLFKSLGGLIILITVISMLFIANKNFKMNALHASVLIVCSFFYNILSDVHIDSDYSFGSLLMSFFRQRFEDENSMAVDEVHERVFAAIMWMALCYPVFLALYYTAHRVIKAYTSKAVK